MSALNQRVLVFDSGAGGLSIARAILDQQDSIILDYIADNAGFPYGLRSEKDLIERVTHSISAAIDIGLQADLVVIACNTASTLVLETLRERFSCEFVGVVPAIKPAARLTVTGCIGLLATPATVERTYTRRLIAEFAGSKHLISLGSSKLVTVAESWIYDEPLDMEVLKQELSLLFNQPQGNEIDVLVLACTHFPLIKDAIKSVIPGNTQVVDSGEAVARRVSFLLNNRVSENVPKDDSKTQSSTILVNAKSASESEHIAAAYGKYLFSTSNTIHRNWRWIQYS